MPNITKVLFSWRQNIHMEVYVKEHLGHVFNKYLFAIVYGIKYAKSF